MLILIPGFFFPEDFFLLPLLPFVWFFFFLMLTGEAAWVPHANCFLIGTLPFFFALSHSAITECTTKDPEGSQTLIDAADSAWPSNPHRELSAVAGAGQSKCFLLCPVMIRKSKTSKAGQCLVPQDNLGRKHGSSLPKSATCGPVCQKGIVQNLVWLRGNSQWRFLGNLL